MKLKVKILYLLLLIPLLNIYAQTIEQIDNIYVLQAKVINNDTVYIYNLPPVFIFPGDEKESKRAQRRYTRLMYNIKKVYPYALLANEKLIELNDTLLQIQGEAERKAFIKDYEKKIVEQYEDELKKLTITQGRLLIKLIDRETGDTSYELVKELRGNFSAVFWQTLARLFGSSLKTEYDPHGQDRTIEEIVVMIEQGLI